MTDRLTARFCRVQHYMEARGFTVRCGFCIHEKKVHPTMDVERQDSPEFYEWRPYDPADPRQRVWALIVASREAIRRFET